MKKRPKISILVPTYRVGGFDVLAESLARQTEKDFELVIVDHFHAKRSDAAAWLLQKRGVERVQHLQPRPCPWKFPTYSGANTFNTGFLAARGEILVIACDYWLATDPNWLRKLTDGLERFEARVGECPYHVLLDPPKMLDPVTWRGNWYNSPWVRHEVRESAPADGGFWEVGRFPDTKPGEAMPDQLAYVMKNMAIRREHLLHVRGMDEAYDGGHGQTDIELGIRLRLAGVQFRFADAPAAVIRMHEHHVQMRPERTDADITTTYLNRWDSPSACYSIYPEKSQIPGPRLRRFKTTCVDHGRFVEMGAGLPRWARFLPSRLRAMWVARGLRKRLTGQVAPEVVQIQLSDGRAWDLTDKWKIREAPAAKRPTWGRRWVSAADRPRTIAYVSEMSLRHEDADILVFAPTASGLLEKLSYLMPEEIAAGPNGELAFYRFLYEKITNGAELEPEEFVKRFLEGGGRFIPWPS